MCVLNKLCHKFHNMPPASWRLTFWPWKWCPESRVTWATYLCTNFNLPRPLCSRLRPDVRDIHTDVRQTNVRRASSVNAPALLHNRATGSAGVLTVLSCYIPNYRRTMDERSVLWRSTNQLVFTCIPISWQHGSNVHIWPKLVDVTRSRPSPWPALARG